MVKKSSIYHFPVGNGDMTLIKIASNDIFHYVLVDMNIRKNGAKEDEKCDALAELRKLLPSDSENRPYVDVLVLTHPDEDHIRGFQDNFHIGEPKCYKKPDKKEDGKIFVREIWSSPMVFRRKRKTESLCGDAKEFKKEAKRRVELYRKSKSIGIQGNRIRIIGNDIDGKTDDIKNIVYEIGDVINLLNETKLKELHIEVLAPLSDDEFTDSEAIDKNRSSIIMQWSIASHGYCDPTNFVMLAGDASVEAWEVLWSKYKKDSSKLQYDILLAPHHCSWHTLSHDSYSESDDPQVSKDALSALSQARAGCVILSSSTPIEDNDNDPPNYGAKGEYEKITKKNSGAFKCLANNIPPGKKVPVVAEYRLTREGPQPVTANTQKEPDSKAAKRTAATSTLFTQTGQAIGHG